MLEWASARNRTDVKEANGFSSVMAPSTAPSTAALGHAVPQQPARKTAGGAEAPDPAPAPKSGISLALGGGAARGWAHIGVLRALDEAGIEINMIAGTSIGALVGGCYLAGKLDELEEFARTLTKRRIFGLLDLHLGGNGLLGGIKLTARMQEHMNGIRFEDLPKPFVCVASEIRTGHEIWLSSGSLITAMRASYALPGVFEPVTCNKRVLVDGALVNPVPVSVCRAHEQQLVVAVNLHYDLYGRAAVIKHSAGDLVIEKDAAAPGQKPTSAPSREARLGITGVMVEAFNIIQDRISRARLAGDPPDMSLQPRLGHIGLSEFHRAEELIKIGYDCAMAQMADLKRLQTVLA
ncbi:MAG: patatin-like phospholipase family protein [Rhizobiaceae bacterium]|nr:patatin-like phospholipase family protein [Rhizobiaceae bacterium]